MNPVPHKPAVELIPGVHTSAGTVERTRTLLTEMGKKAIDVKDACGFVSNRVLMLTVNEAAFLVHEGVAEAEAVDEVFRGCFGHPMGPLRDRRPDRRRHDPVQRRGAVRALRRQQVPARARCSSR